MALRLNGFLGYKDGTLRYSAPATPVGGVVGGMPCRLIAGTGLITLATAFTYANAFDRVLGLFRYNEATMLSNVPNYESTWLCGYGSQVTIEMGTDYQTTHADDISPYDVALTYQYGDPLYVSAATGQLTNNVAAASGVTPAPIAMVVVAPTSPTTGSAMRIKLLL